MANQQIKITREEAVERAKKDATRDVSYRLGKGGYDCTATYADQDGEADCSGGVSHFMAIDREQDDFHGISGPWIETSAIVADAQGPQTWFREVNAPQLGTLIVYGDSASGSEGHVGMVTSLKSNGDPATIGHCNARTNPALVIEDADVWWLPNFDSRNMIYADPLFYVEENVNLVKTRVIVDGKEGVGVFDNDTDANYVEFADLKTALSDGIPRTWDWDDKADPMTLTIGKG